MTDSAVPTAKPVLIPINLKASELGQWLGETAPAVLTTDIHNNRNVENVRSNILKNYKPETYGVEAAPSTKNDWNNKNDQPVNTYGRSESAAVTAKNFADIEPIDVERSHSPNSALIFTMEKEPQNRVRYSLKLAGEGLGLKDEEVGDDFKFPVGSSPSREKVAELLDKYGEKLDKHGLGFHKDNISRAQARYEADPMLAAAMDAQDSEAVDAHLRARMFESNSVMAENIEDALANAKSAHGEDANVLVSAGQDHIISAKGEEDIPTVPQELEKLGIYGAAKVHIVPVTGSELPGKVYMVKDDPNAWVVTTKDVDGSGQVLSDMYSIEDKSAAQPAPELSQSKPEVAPKPTIAEAMLKKTSETTQDVPAPAAQDAPALQELPPPQSAPAPKNEDMSKFDGLIGDLKFGGMKAVEPESMGVDVASAEIPESKTMELQAPTLSSGVVDLDKSISV